MAWLLADTANNLFRQGINNSNLCNGANVCGNNVGLEGTLGRVILTLIFVVGAVSVIMIIVGGLRYVLSNGDPSGAKNAKNTILYAVIGIIVAIAAYGIVQFVIGRFN